MGSFFPRIQIVVTHSGQACADLTQQTRSHAVPFDQTKQGSAWLLARYSEGERDILSRGRLRPNESIIAAMRTVLVTHRCRPSGLFETGDGERSARFFCE